MPWIQHRHRCYPPTDELDQTRDQIRFWRCPLCFQEFEVKIGMGTTWTTPDGRSGLATTVKRLDPLR